MKRNIKKITGLLFGLSMLSFSACELSAVQKQGSDNMTSESKTDKINAVFGEIRTEFPDAPDLSDYPFTLSNVPDDFYSVYEAENAHLEGKCTVQQSSSDFSNNAYVSGFEGEGDKITFDVDIEFSGFYDLNFVCRSSDSGRENYVYIDDEHVGDVVCNSDGKVVDSFLYNIYLDKGKHSISLLPCWGYTEYDCLKLTACSMITDKTYKITQELSNPDADEHTKGLYQFLCDIYGKYSLSGQFADKGRMSSELKQIEKATGKEFAVLGLDMMDYGSTNKANGVQGRTVEYAYDWYNNAGGIVQFCWHWTSPGEYAINDSEHPWYSSFYADGSKINLDKIMSGEDERGYELLMADIDNISQELKRLCDSGVPIIWRPLHEVGGGWFWWGNCKPESYKKLWITMYDKMTKEHNLTNLIWMWNGLDPEWYPGDEYVDIISCDIYQGNHVYTSFSGTFAKAAACSTSGKLIALSENGCVMDPDLVMRDNARWLFWGTWADPYTLYKGAVLNEEYTEKDMLIKAYNHERVLTLDELPDLKSYYSE